MPVELYEKVDGNILEVRLTGKLTKADYAKFVPEAERLIAKHGKVRMLVTMQDFHGWGAGAMWEDAKFGLRHFSDIERLAMVGEKRWQKGLALFCKPFTKAEVRYYTPEEADRAHAWLEGA